jgi:hypothetical protein
VLPSPLLLPLSLPCSFLSRPYFPQRGISPHLRTPGHRNSAGPPFIQRQPGELYWSKARRWADPRLGASLPSGLQLRLDEGTEILAATPRPRFATAAPTKLKHAQPSSQLYCGGNLYRGQRWDSLRALGSPMLTTSSLTTQNGAATPNWCKIYSCFMTSADHYLR